MSTTLNDSELRELIIDNLWGGDFESSYEDLDVGERQIVDSEFKFISSYLNAKLQKARKDGILEGFNMSSEGFNGEYPYGDRDASDEEIWSDIAPRELKQGATQPNKEQL